LERGVERVARGKDLGLRGACVDVSLIDAGVSAEAKRRAGETKQAAIRLVASVLRQRHGVNQMKQVGQRAEHRRAVGVAQRMAPRSSQALGEESLGGNRSRRAVFS